MTFRRLRQVACAFKGHDVARAGHAAIECQRCGWRMVLPKGWRWVRWE